MAYLIDANVLVRLVQTADPDHAVANNAITTLSRRGETLCVTPQNLVEFWNVCTRPSTSRGGYGQTTHEAATRVRELENAFTLLPDNSEIHEDWKRLVELHEVRGSQVHDARLAAAMTTHGISDILPFNTKDFARYTALTAVNPVSLSGQPDKK